MISTLNDWAAIVPSLYLIGVALAIVGLDLFLPREGERKAAVALGLAGVGFALAWVVLRIVGGGASAAAFNGAVVMDPLALFLSVPILAATGLSLLLSGPTLKRVGMNLGEYYALILVAGAGMILLVQSLDLITFFVSLEVLSLALYILSGFSRKDPRSNEAAIKYLVTGAFASGFLLYGMALLYGATGQLSIPAIGEALVLRPGILGTLGITLFSVGLLFKVGAVPFHMWVPDVYQGAPTPVTAFMSVTVKAGAFGAFIRFLQNLGGSSTLVWGDLLSGAAVATLVAGNLLALRQRNVKRMLAYSSIAHSGYVLVGLASMRREGTGEMSWTAGEASTFYLFVYTFMTLGAFAFIMAAGRGRDAEELEDYAGLAKRRPWYALAMTIFMVSLAGLPPTGGFFGKFMVFREALASGHHLLVVVGVLASAVSVYYYLRVTVYMYMHDEPEGAPVTPMRGAAVVVLICAVFTAALGLFPAPVAGLAGALFAR